MATYNGGRLIEEAQAMLDAHTVSYADGLCQGCGAVAPCPEHEAAARVSWSPNDFPGGLGGPAQTWCCVLLASGLAPSARSDEP